MREAAIHTHFHTHTHTHISIFASLTINPDFLRPTAFDY